jgi:hypothetical protein
MGIFRWLTGQEVFDAWRIGPDHGPDPLDFVDHNGNNRRDIARARSFPDLAKVLSAKEVRSTRSRKSLRGQPRGR